MPPALRPAFATLWNLDLALADVVATSSDPALGAIRLAWWRERLDALDLEGAPAEPRLAAVVSHLLDRGVSGKQLSPLEDAWLPLFAPFPWGHPQVDGLRLRGRVLFGIGARLLGGEAAETEAAGAIWSLVDGAQYCSDPPSREFLLAEARRTLGEIPRTLPRAVRPLTVLGAVAASDALGRGRTTRVAAALAHRLRGSLPRG